MTLGQSDLIALGALLVAILSALYAKRTSIKLAMHFKMVEIYEDVLNFSDCFRGLFSVPTPERLESFRFNAVRNSELYFSEKVLNGLEEVYSHCIEQETWLSIAEDRNSVPIEGIKLPPVIEIRSEYKAVMALILPVLKNMKIEIKNNMA